MIKKLLSAAFFAAVALSATAYEVNDYAYTKVKKFRITGANLVTNGQFNQGATGTDGWTATDGTLPLETTFTMLTGGPNGSNSQQVLAGQTALTNGMYQSIMVNEGGSYIVSLKVMGAAAGFTDLDMTGGNVNYINAYWNTNNVLATVDGDNLLYGEGVTTTNPDDGTTSVGAGVSGGYGFSFDTNGFTEAVFSIDAPAGGYIIIDFRGLNEGLQIADVCCHKAEEVYDDRVAIDRIAYFNKYLVSDGIEEREFFEDFQASVAEVQDALERGATPDEMTIVMDNLEGIWAEFVAVNFENVIDIVPTTDGSANTGNNSANWMNWKSKWNKLKNDYNGKAPWTWSTDRWCHKTAAENSPMAIDWQRGNANNSWNNIATLTTKLSAGKYYWGVTGQGGMKTLNKNRWARSWANECAETKLFFNGDTILVDTLNAARNQDYVLEFVLEEAKEVTLGIICNNVSEYANAGFDVHFYSPVLYKLIVEGEYTEGQKAYIAAANTQLEALAGRLAVAYGYCEAANDTLPWGKEALKAGADEAQARFDAWAAMDTTAMLAMMDNDEVLGDTIMNNGVRFLNNYITPFEAMNKPFTDMPGAIAAAEETMAKRIYSSSTKMGDLQAEINESKTMYAEKLKVPFSSEDSLALITQREEMNAMVEAFKLAIVAEAIVDINFGTQEAPAKFNVNTTVDAEGIEVTTYSIDGAKGSIVFTDVTGVAADGTEIAGGSYPYMLGYNNADSLGMLRVGNSEAVVKFAGAPVKATDIVNIKFDWYAGNLNKSKAGYKVLTEAGDTICGLFYSAYDGNDDMNTFGINYGSLPKVGDRNNSNAAIAAASNKTAFDIVLDYGKGMMYCTTVSSKGTQVSEEFAIPAGKVPAQFVVYSNYGNADRRCWFDNLLIQNIAAGEDTGIESIQMGKPAGDGAIYNIMGQRILKPVKGQIYIQNGVKNIAR